MRFYCTRLYRFNMSLVAVSIDKLDRMFCEVDLGQLKLGNAIHNRAVLLESLVPLFHTKASKDIPRLALKEGGDGKVQSEGASSQGLLFIHRLSFFRRYSIVHRARVLLYCTSSQVLALRSSPFFRCYSIVRVSLC